MRTCTSGARREWLTAGVFGATGWLCLAATPTFAMMALLTTMPGASAPMVCSAAPDASPLSGMAWMYVLMSVFHSGPWLKLIASRRGSARQS